MELSDLTGGPALQALIDHGVPFVVVGGLAVAANGYRRPTKDIDVLIADSTDSKARVVAALALRGGVIDRTGDPVASVDWTDDRALIVSRGRHPRRRAPRRCGSAQLQGGARAGPREEVRPLAPATVESMRSAMLDGSGGQPLRDATLVSVLAYSGLRPGEALGLRWGDVGERTVLVQRAISLGKEADTKTRQHRSVRLLAPLRSDLAEWRLASGRPDDAALVFPASGGGAWTEAAYQSWRRRAFGRALAAAGIDRARPYDLRHSFASLLLHEGRNVIYVARQLGHDGRLTTDRYVHVIEEYEDDPGLDAETAIRRARESQNGARSSARKPR